MELVKIEVDGKELMAPKGGNLLEFLLEKGFDIPYLCYHPSLESIGACRMCAVEIEGTKNLQMACTTEIKEGLKVKTNTERVSKARKMNLSLILSEHPNECMTCDMNGHCTLQDLTYRYFPDGKPYFGFSKRGIGIDDSSEFILRDLNKCIQCQLCVRVCDEIEGMSIYAMANRGYEELPSTAYNLPLAETKCVSCGQCASICPTGAIVEKPSVGKARWWEVEKTKTTCAYCGVGCQIELYVDREKNEIVRVMPSPENPEVNDGVATCVKGKFGYEFTNHPDRLGEPLIKKDGKFVETTWEEALNYTATRLKEIVERYGPDSIMFLSSARCTNEENYLLQKFARAVIGTNNVDHCARLCHASTVAGLAATLGSGAMTNNLSDILQADTILLTGSNPTENHPVYASRIKRAVKKGAKLIVADPRKIELVDYATIWLRHLPGTDVALFNGLLNVLIQENLIDEEFISARTEGFEEVKKAVEPFTPEYVSKITNVPADNIRKAALIYGKAERAAIVYAMGITQHVSGTKNVISLANLAMATGNLGKFGTGVNPLRGQGNVQGACDLGALPNVLPGYQKVNDPDVRQKFEKFWGVKLPSQVGLSVSEMADAVLDERIKVIFIMGENPRMSDPDAKHVEEALKKAEFIVSLDIFPNDTNKFADVILPASSQYEKDGTITNTERRIQRVRKAVKPYGNSKPDWIILKELFKRFGFPADYSHPEEIMEEISKVTPIYGGISYKRIEKKGLQWPCRNDDDPGTAVLHIKKFSRPNGKGKFIAVDFSEPPELPDKEYPFYLSTGRILYHYHTGTMTRRVRGLDKLKPELEIEMNPDDAKKLGIANGERVRVTSRRGSITGKVKITDRSMERMVFIPFHYSEAAANILTLNVLDPMSKIPTLKVAAVKVEKLERKDR